jgi:hypothetical protein
VIQSVLIKAGAQGMVIIGEYERIRAFLDLEDGGQVLVNP